MKKFLHVLKKKLVDCGYDVIRVTPGCSELSAIDQQKKLLNGINVKTIFDVGAHKGYKSLEYAKLFPHSRIFAFEPFKGSFDELVKNVSMFDNIKPINSGLLDTPGRNKFYNYTSSMTNSILKNNENAHKIWGKGLMDSQSEVECHFTTIDDFCAARNIENIDLLKLDTQGSELRVLEGATKTLKNKAITLIHTEMIIAPCYIGQPFIEEFISYLRYYDYCIFGLYNMLWLKGRLLQIDAIFLPDE